MTKYLLLIVAFSNQPLGVSLKPVASYDQSHECQLFAEIENLKAVELKIPERLTCIKVNL